MQVERLPNHDALVPLEPGSYLLGLRVSRHDRDATLQHRPAVHDGEIQRQPRHGRQVDVEQQRIRLLGGDQLVGRLRAPGADDAQALAREGALEHPAQRRLVVDDEDGARPVAHEAET